MSVPMDVLQFVKAHHRERTLSAYLDGSATDPAERRHWRVELKRELARARESLEAAPRAERDAFEQCAARLLDGVPGGEQMLGAPGWACFCAASGEVLSSALPARTATLVVWRDGPFVVPYIAAASVDPSVVVLVDWKGAGIWRLDGTLLDHVASIRTVAHIEAASHMGDTPRRGFHGPTRGATQADETQRQLREARARLVEEVVSRLGTLANGERCVVVGGGAEASAALVRALPPGIAARTAVAPALAVDSPHVDVVRIARATVGGIAERRQLQHLADWQRHAHPGGHSAFGLESIAAAAIAGAVERIIISPRLCAAEPDRVEDLVQLALVDGARVETAGDAASLRLDGEAGGIAAELRFAPPQVGDDAAAPRALLHQA